MANILLIDDDDGVRSVLVRLLEGMGHTVKSVSDGKIGLNALASGGVDVVLTDLIMPGMEGLDTIREVRKKFSSTPVIAMSGGGRIGPDNYLKLAKGMGACATMTKPFTRDDLAQTLARALAPTEAGLRGN